MSTASPLYGSFGILAWIKFYCSLVTIQHVQLVASPIFNCDMCGKIPETSNTLINSSVYFMASSSLSVLLMELYFATSPGNLSVMFWFILFTISLIGARVGPFIEPLCVMSMFLWVWTDTFPQLQQCICKHSNCIRQIDDVWSVENWAVTISNCQEKV